MDALSNLPGNSSGDNHLLPDGTDTNGYQNLTVQEKIERDNARESWIHGLTPTTSLIYSLQPDINNAQAILERNSLNDFVTVSFINGRRKYSPTWAWRQAASFTELVNSLIIKRDAAIQKSRAALGGKGDDSEDKSKVEQYKEEYGKIATHVDLINTVVSNIANDRLLLLITNFLIEEQPKMVGELTSYIHAKIASVNEINDSLTEIKTKAVGRSKADSKTSKDSDTNKGSEVTRAKKTSQARKTPKR